MRQDEAKNWGQDGLINMAQDGAKAEPRRAMLPAFLHGFRAIAAYRLQNAKMGLKWGKIGPSWAKKSPWREWAVKMGAKMEPKWGQDGVKMEQEGIRA